MTGEIVDTHTHLLPDRLAAAIRRFFDDHLPGRLMYPIDVAEAVAALRRAGVTRVWNLPYVHRPGIADDLNDRMAEIGERHGGDGVTIITGCTAHPADPDPGGSIRRAAERNGARVVKVHCSVGDHGVGDRRLDPIYAAAADLRMPVVVHVGSTPDGRTGADAVSSLRDVALRFADTRFVLAHCGQPSVREAVALLDARPNVWADLTPVVGEPVAIGRDDVLRLQDRLLFGSDCPNTGRTIETLLSDLDALELPPDVLRRITAENASTLVG